MALPGAAAALREVGIASAVAKARTTEADAAGRVGSRSFALTELQTKGIASASRLAAAAEETVARARRAHGPATGDLKSKLSGLTSAQRSSERVAVGGHVFVATSASADSRNRFARLLGGVILVPRDQG